MSENMYVFILVRLVAHVVLVWPARPSQQAPRGEEGKDGLAYIAISSHLALSNRKAEKVNRQ